LTLNPSGNVQFKSNAVGDVAQQSQASSGAISLRLTEASLRGLEKNGNGGSQRQIDEKSLAERSINFM